MNEVMLTAMIKVERGDLQDTADFEWKDDFVENLGVESLFTSLDFLVVDGKWIAAIPVETDFPSSLKGFGSISMKHVYLWLASATSLISTFRGSPSAEWQQPSVLLGVLGSSLGFAGAVMLLPNALQIIVQGDIIFFSLSSD